MFLYIGWLFIWIYYIQAIKVLLKPVQDVHNNCNVFDLLCTNNKANKAYKLAIILWALSKQI